MSRSVDGKYVMQFRCFAFSHASNNYVLQKSFTTSSNPSNSAITAYGSPTLVVGSIQHLAYSIFDSKPRALSCLSRIQDLDTDVPCPELMIPGPSISDDIIILRLDTLWIIHSLNIFARRIPDSTLLVILLISIMKHPVQLASAEPSDTESRWCGTSSSSNEGRHTHEFDISVVNWMLRGVVVGAVPTLHHGKADQESGEDDEDEDAVDCKGDSVFALEGDVWSEVVDCNFGYDVVAGWGGTIGGDAVHLVRGWSVRGRGGSVRLGSRVGWLG
jgi:hypothetical protein